ncbi:MAG: NAD-dependent epimerase/dehydratase family protein [Candidatus Marsarchaeota archaeon]|jgi:UDP-glucose 4-epimerase|nr:NAD-dependent epimerase/dehydratase family protein [Candidatus Marsarchaeota archaeon]
MSKKIIVTGGAGFIGSNIVNSLCADNEVLIIDNLHTGSMDNVNESVKLGAKFYKGDSGDIAQAHFDPDIIFHLGMYSSTPMYREDKSLVARVVGDAINIFNFASERNIPIILASSSSLYNGHKPPYREDLVPLAKDFYTEARLAVERLANVYSEQHGLNATALRMFAVYGPHDENKGRYANLVTQFMLSMRRGESPVVYGDGEQTRDFTYIDDVVRAFHLAMGLEGFNVFNVGRGESFTINKMIGKLNEHLGTDIKAKYVPIPIVNYVEQTEADTTKAERVLGFRAKYSLDEGISKFQEFLDSKARLPS